MTAGFLKVINKVLVSKKSSVVYRNIDLILKVFSVKWKYSNRQFTQN